MKQLLSVVVCLFSVSLAAGQSGPVEDHIKKLERDWAQAMVKGGGAGAVDQYEADDYIGTDPTGKVTDKTQDKKDMSSGNVKYEALDLTDLKVSVYGNTAVATGGSDVKGSFNGQDMSGKYRFTDTWVKRNGKWQAVASQVGKVQ